MDRKRIELKEPEPIEECKFNDLSFACKLQVLMSIIRDSFIKDYAKKYAELEQTNPTCQKINGRWVLKNEK